ncbi:uncharacterized protein BDR25DRAFT_387747 [Lindgomyces ingoldianus]|uniref:Uncharacterized protein n=1 Tax=Lindgomyces ingoldianus TaxID=673940 RepID=A0ACB6R340_9PLEO|nr:uncharacterized protein BDR25DRAFT_387747 [Lindgomyces ingoldianus]KAF2473477.1 hypothetical protein BDR25DRAFT_387747 [Lindgomyces ingoldianus]
MNRSQAYKTRPPTRRDPRKRQGLVRTVSSLFKGKALGSEGHSYNSSTPPRKEHKASLLGIKKRAIFKRNTERPCAQCANAKSPSFPVPNANLIDDPPLPYSLLGLPRREEGTYTSGANGTPSSSVVTELDVCSRPPSPRPPLSSMDESDAQEIANRICRTLSESSAFQDESSSVRAASATATGGFHSYTPTRSRSYTVASSNGEDMLVSQNPAVLREPDSMSNSVSESNPSSLALIRSLYQQNAQELEHARLSQHSTIKSDHVYAFQLQEELYQAQEQEKGQEQEQGGRSDRKSEQDRGTPCPDCHTNVFLSTIEEDLREQKPDSLHNWYPHCMETNSEEKGHEFLGWHHGGGLSTLVEDHREAEDQFSHSCMHTFTPTINSAAFTFDNLITPITLPNIHEGLIMDPTGVSSSSFRYRHPQASPIHYARFPPPPPAVVMEPVRPTIYTNGGINVPASVINPQLVSALPELFVDTIIPDDVYISSYAYNRDCEERQQGEFRVQTTAESMAEPTETPKDETTAEPIIVSTREHTGEPIKVSTREVSRVSTKDTTSPAKCASPPPKPTNTDPFGWQSRNKAKLIGVTICLLILIYLGFYLSLHARIRYKHGGWPAVRDNPFEYPDGGMTMEESESREGVLIAIFVGGVVGLIFLGYGVVWAWRRYDIGNNVKNVGSPTSSAAVGIAH